MKVERQTLIAAIEAVRRGDRGAEDRLAVDCLFPISAHALADFGMRQGTFDDLQQVALLAIWRACPKLDLAKNPYSYLRKVAYRAILKEAARENRWHDRHPPIEEEGGTT